MSWRCDRIECFDAPFREQLCLKHYGERLVSRDLRLQEVELSDGEVAQIGEVVDALATHAMSFLWEPLARRKFSD